MLLDQISTLLTQLVVFYIPINDINVKITCGLAITSIIYYLLKSIYINAKKIIHYHDRYQQPPSKGIELIID